MLSPTFTVAIAASLYRNYYGTDFFHVKNDLDWSRCTQTVIDRFEYWLAGMVVADQHGEAAGTSEYRPLSEDARQLDLQLEAKAHIIVQKWIDGGGLKGRALSSDGICEVHRRPCELLPEDLLEVEHPEAKDRVRVVSGSLPGKDVKVGAHILIAVSPTADAQGTTAAASIGCQDLVIL
jgi:hypothetical protein